MVVPPVLGHGARKSQRGGGAVPGGRVGASGKPQHRGGAMEQGEEEGVRLCVRVVHAFALLTCVVESASFWVCSFPGEIFMPL